MIYRQRFTPKGLLGAILFVLGPAISGWLVMDYLSSPSYERAGGILVFLSTLLAPIGAALALVGREYYDARAEIEREQEEAKKLADLDAEKRKSIGF